MPERPIPLAPWSKASLWLLACWDDGLISCQGHGCLSLVSVVFHRVEAFATDWSLVQCSPTECVVCKVGITQGYWICNSPWSSVATYWASRE